jgi:hypothetical protein
MHKSNSRKEINPHSSASTKNHQFGLVHPKSSKPSYRKPSTKAPAKSQGNVNSLSSGLGYNRYNLAHSLGKVDHGQIEKKNARQEINSSMNSRLNANTGSYMQRESILNQKYSRKVNKPTIRNNLLNSIKNKQPESGVKKPVTGSSLY